jgi:glycogenin
MSQETAPFVPPERYPSPPKDMWYKVPEQPPAYRTEKPKSIFPWESNRPRPTRIFADDSPQVQETEAEAPTTPTGEPWGSTSSDTQPSAESSLTEHSSNDTVPVTPITPTIHVTSSDPWTAFTRTNAWDEVPEIERYVDKMQKHRRTKSLKSPGKIEMPGVGGAVSERDFARRGSKVTDFPSEAERPSLPVTPAPIRRPKFWGGGVPGIGDDNDDDPLLPAAEGVPGQSEWVCVHGLRWKPSDCLCDLTNVLRHYKDPVAQLQKLAKQQSEVLLQKLGGASRDSSDLPPRAVPFGSEELVSPTYVARSPHVLSPQPVKGSASSSMVRGIVSEEEATPRTSTQPNAVTTSSPLPSPSYSGPGTEFEKGEDYAQHSTPALPTEEERDVLDT